MFTKLKNILYYILWLFILIVLCIKFKAIFINQDVLSISFVDTETVEKMKKEVKHTYSSYTEKYYKNDFNQYIVEINQNNKELSNEMVEEYNEYIHNNNKNNKYLITEFNDILKKEKSNESLEKATNKIITEYKISEKENKKNLEYAMKVIINKDYLQTQ